MGGRTARLEVREGRDVALVARRAIVAFVSAGVTVAALVVLVAAIALRVDWDVPEPVALSGPTVLLDVNGDPLARFTAEVDREVVTLDQVAPVVVDAVVAAEDARFYEHDGVDPLSLVRAVVSNVRTGGIAQGGSTLTQQYVKNAFVGDDQTLMRKVREAVVAIALERSTSKEEIVERYLNTVAFGEGAEGIEAAARTYFGVGAADLDAAQAATLAQLLPAPSVRNPRADPAGAEARRDALLARMGELGSLTPEEVAAALATPLEVAPRPHVTTDAPAFVGYVRRQIAHAFGPEAVLTGALTVQTTYDPAVQRALDDAVAEVLPADEVGDVQAGAVAIDPRSGAILAIHGRRDMQLGDLDLATMTRRQNGSAFKPFVLAAALEDELVTPSSTRPAPGSVTISDCVDHDGAAITVRGGPGGSLTVHEALVRSTNTTYQLLGCELGGPRIVEGARRLGVASEVGTEAAVALGGSSFGASVLDMASAYGTFANDGMLCPARSIAEVRDRDGTVVDLPDEVVVIPDQPRTPRRPDAELLDARPDELRERDADGCHGALDARVARQVTEALQGVIERGTGRAADIGRPQGGKTGTTTDAKDAWFVGVTPELSLAVWIGDPGDDGEVSPLSDLLGLSEVTGGSLPAAIWARAAEVALADVEPTPFPSVEDLAIEDDGSPRPGPARQIPTDPTPEPEPEPTPDETGEDDDAVADDGDTDEPAPPPPGDDDADADPADDADDDGGPPDDEDDDDRCLIVFRC
ncbi:transglycosylase domain-containing protein [Nitriliruptor alkaliphilus]|uniref:transglycosylase domain-containing protein n=1 Tax=Nitriliruptor alkaliphilus TaxID=427918 RepID=UPI0006990D55|nr:transglycosylase domain-containing protein [Nitriliruptor alkaliphilus]